MLDLLFVDRDGYLWLAAGPDLYWYDGLSFNQVKTDTTGRFGDAISSFYHHRNDQMWIGWEKRQYSIVEDSTVAYQAEEGFHRHRFWPGQRISLGQLWMATDGEGLYVKNQEGRWYNFNADDGLPSDDSYALLPHKKGVVLATDQGLAWASFKNDKKVIKTYWEEGRAFRIKS
ncbi:MAG: hypothetical protein U5L96_04325 [Owenweeksia sp.]|nr:hypothetical protein [Owenweeksia sp.]